MSDPGPPPRSEPWEVALQLSTVALGRGAGVMLDMETRAAFIDMLKSGWARAVKEGRQDEFDAAAQQMITALVNAIRARGGERGPEYRSGRPQASIRQLPADEFHAGFASLCPGFWPFC